MKAKFNTVIVAAACIAALVPQPAASQSKDWTEADYAMLPEVCRARLKYKDKPELQKSWSDKVGAGNFLHIHHYCFGLWYEQKAQLEFNARKKKELLGTASDQYDYVLRHWPADSKLRPEVEMRKNRVDALFRMTK